MEKESASHPAHSPLDQADQIADGEGETVVEGITDQCANEPAEPRRVEDTNIKMDLSGGTSNPTPDEPPGPDPKLPESKPKHKYAFVKIMELDEKRMLTSYLEAYFGESYRPPFLI